VFVEQNRIVAASVEVVDGTVFEKDWSRAREDFGRSDSSEMCWILTKLKNGLSQHFNA
jgi:hypothetical protein